MTAAKTYRIEDGLVIDSQSGAFRFGVESEGLKRFTAYIYYDEQDVVEEIDVDAKDYGEARDIATRAAESFYEEGGVIRHVEERFGLYF